MIHLLGDVLELVVLLASRIRLAGLVLAALVVVVLVVAVRRARRATARPLTQEEFFRYVADKFTNDFYEVCTFNYADEKNAKDGNPMQKCR